MRIHYDPLFLTGPHARFDKITYMASRVLNAPTSLLTMIDDVADQLSLKSAFGVPYELLQTRSIPLSHSLSIYVRNSGEPLVVADAREHPQLMHHPAIKKFDIVSYLGVPFHGERGETLGALCCIDSRAREWGEEDIENLTQLASIASDQFQLSSAIKNRARAKLLAEQAVAMRAGFLSHANHEFLTPLSAILGASRLLSVVTVKEQARSLVEVIQRNTSHLSALTDDFVRTAALDNATKLIEAASFDLVEVVNDVVERHRYLAETKQIGITVENHVGEDATFLFDREILTNVMERLVGNALDFTSDGEVRIAIEADHSERGIVVRVSDTGVGIGTELQNTLFEEFEGQNSRTARVGGGTGLGMSIIRREIELMGGAISVSSRPGEGTNFMIYLPMFRSLNHNVLTEHDRVDDYHRLTCLECGEKLSLLRRHLRQEHGTTPDAYRAKWRLPEDFELTSAGYKEMRRAARSRMTPM